MLKNITLSADEKLIKKAREKARRERTTLNESFRQWLKQFTNSNIKTDDYDQLLQSFNYVKVGGKFTRSELNER
jgi:hypothetical protein